MCEQERLLKRISAYDFAILELQIFLDTHPMNKQANMKLEEYTTKSNVLTTEYEQKFGPIQADNIELNRLAWISNPWPWDNKEEY